METHFNCLALMQQDSRPSRVEKSQEISLVRKAVPVAQPLLPKLALQEFRQESEDAALAGVEDLEIRAVLGIPVLLATSTLALHAARLSRGSCV